jgi:hypothetical protein
MLIVMRVMASVVICCGCLAGCGPHGPHATPIPNGFVAPPTPGPAPTTASTPQLLTSEAWTFQGWGVSLAWWAEIVGGWPPADQEPVVQALFGDPSSPGWPIVGGRTVPPLGLNIIRYNLGASPAGGGTDSCHASFRVGASIPTVMAGAGQAVNLSQDGSQIGVLKAAFDLIKKRGGHPVVEAFANSPPYWLVPGGCPQGTDGPESLGPGAQGDYVRYLAAVVTALRDSKGVEVSSVDPFNEPTIPWPNDCSSGCQEGAGFSLDTQQAILARLCQALPAGVSVSAPDGNSPDDTIGAWQTYLKSLSCVRQVNTHSYQNGASPYDGPYRPHLAQLVRQGGRALWMSEFGSSSPLSVATQIADDLNALRPAAWVYWTAMEGDSGWGLFTDPLLPHSQGDPGAGLSANERYFAFAQYTRFIRPGDTIIPISASYPSGLRIVVARPSAGGIVLVAVNPAGQPAQLSFDLGSVGVGTNVAATVYRTDATDRLAKLPASVLGGVLTDSLPAGSISTYVIGAAPTAPCSSRTFLSVVMRKYGAAGRTISASGQPACAGGYAQEGFTPYPGGQQAPFFFKQDASGNWALIEGGNAIPYVACSTIPPRIMAKLGYDCPPIAILPSPPTPAGS